jgi:ubiquinone/menaquinone biosynthesis C-methylase UbiE
MLRAPVRGREARNFRENPGWNGGIRVVKTYQQAQTGGTASLTGPGMPLIHSRRKQCKRPAMNPKPPEELKEAVHDYWNRQSCGTYATNADKYTVPYFEDIEAYRYREQAYIHEFAQFTRYHGKRVLEVGFGAGTDFIQWLRAGAIASGIDLTQEAVDNLSHRIAVYQLPQPEQIGVGDAENLQFADNTFDLGYSFGVLHHSPNTERAIGELVRVVKPGGDVKIMVYNKNCICAFKLWVKYALLRGRPWKSLYWAMWNHMESLGTKSYNRAELKRIFTALPLENIRIHTYVTSADYMAFSAFKPLNLLMRAILACAGNRQPWRREDYQFAAADGSTPKTKPRTGVEFTGNPFGFFVCITATKKPASQAA